MSTEKPISADDIEQAADRLAAAGQRVSVATVRAELGRGSNSTIAPVLGQWRERTAAEAALPPVPEGLQEVAQKALGAIWAEAIRQHRAELLAVQSAADKRVSELQQDTEALEKYGTDLESRLQQALKEIAALKAATDTAEKAKTAAETQAAAMKLQLEDERMRYRELLQTIKTIQIKAEPVKAASKRAEAGILIKGGQHEPAKANAGTD